MLKALLSYASALFASNIFAGLISFFATMFAAKLLSKSEFGAYNHYVLIYSTAGMLFLSGTQQSLITFINADRKTNEPIFIRLMMTYGVVFSLISIIGFVIARIYYTLPTCLGILGIVPNVFTLLAAMVYRSQLRAKGEVSLRMSISFLNSFLTVGLLLLWTSEYAPIIADIFSLVIPGIVVFFLLYKKISGQLSERKWPVASGQKSSDHCSLTTDHLFISPFDPGLRLFWKSTSALWIAGMLFSLNSQFRRIIVDWQLGISELAVQSFVITVYMLVQRPVEMVQRSILPVLSVHQDWEGDEKRIILANIMIFPLLGIGVSAGYPLLIAVGKYDMYLHTLPFFLLICAAIPIASVEFVFSAMCIVKGQEKINRDASIYAVMLNIPMSFIFIIKFGLTGAFWSYPLYTITYAIILGVKLRDVFREQCRFTASLICRCMPVYIGCLLWIYMYPNIWFSLWAVIFFIAGTWALRVWRISDFREFYRAFVR